MFLINMVAISAGGGLQNSLSFLSFLSQNESYKGNYIIFCVKGGAIEGFCIQKKLHFYSINEGTFWRFCYELFFGFYLIKKFKIHLIFSIFGGAPIFSPKIYKISGFAYSNIIQHEVPFWSFLPLFRRLQKKIIDFMRLRLALASDELIVETDYLADRAREGVFRGKVVHVVKMAPSTVVLKGLAECTQEIRTSEYIDILYLSGPHPNKRIHQLHEIFSILNQSEFRYRLLTTLPENSVYLKTVRNVFSLKNMNSALCNIGPITPDKVGTLLGSVDAMINVALLESFSNNWVEAWAAGLPLIVTDANWARHSCHDAAIYIDLTNPERSASKIIEFFRSEDLKAKQKLYGAAQLSSLPAPFDRFEQYIKVINDALNRQGMSL